MITAVNKTTGEEKSFTDEVWDMMERGGHDRNWKDIRKTDNPLVRAAEPPAEVAEAVKKHKPFGDNPPATA